MGNLQGANQQVTVAHGATSTEALLRMADEGLANIELELK